MQGLSSTTNGNLDGTTEANLPLFRHAVNYQLAPTIAGNYALKESSPLIDLGNNTERIFGNALDLAGNPRFNNVTVDMGAFESVSCTLGPIIFVNVKSINYAITYLSERERESSKFNINVFLFDGFTTLGTFDWLDY